ncbi:hypothetical protein L0222_04245 [bacterium]|nr:hypothetical protein [bacterium]MCI0602478.1 hypothetical protein [bacterium]
MKKKRFQALALVLMFAFSFQVFAALAPELSRKLLTSANPVDQFALVIAAFGQQITDFTRISGIRLTPQQITALQTTATDVKRRLPDAKRAVEQALAAIAGESVDSAAFDSAIDPGPFFNPSIARLGGENAVLKNFLAQISQLEKEIDNTVANLSGTPGATPRSTVQQCNAILVNATLGSASGCTICVANAQKAFAALNCGSAR